MIMKVKLLIPLLLLMAACTSNKPMTDEQKAAMKEEGSAVVKEYFDILKTSNLESLTGLMENSPDYTYVVFGDVITYDQNLEMAKEYMPSVKKQTFITKFEKYIIIDPSCFIYLWQGDNGMYMTNGDSTMFNDYVITWTFRKSDGSWKLVFGHESQKVAFPVDTAALH
jgi:hypothetical protein